MDAVLPICRAPLTIRGNRSSFSFHSLRKSSIFLRINLIINTFSFAKIAKNHKIPGSSASFITKFQGATREKSQNSRFLLLLAVFFAETSEGIAQQVMFAESAIRSVVFHGFNYYWRNSFFSQFCVAFISKPRVLLDKFNEPDSVGYGRMVAVVGI